MEGSILRRARRAACAAAAALTVSAALVSPALAAHNPSDPVQKAEHDAAQEIGVQAYKYGVPLLDQDRIFSTYTSVNVCDPVHGGGPVNQLCSAANLVDATERTVPGPNHDTLYTSGWLDLSGNKKYVLHVPSSDRFHGFELIDAYTNNFANIGTPTASLYPDPTVRPYAYPDGDYIVLGPNQTLDPGENNFKLPVIHAPTSRVWVIGRTEVLSPRRAGAALGASEPPATPRPDCVQRSYIPWAPDGGGGPRCRAAGRRDEHQPAGQPRPQPQHQTLLSDDSGAWLLTSSRSPTAQNPGASAKRTTRVATPWRTSRQRRSFGHARP